MQNDDKHCSAANEDVRWAVNYLLEQIAAKLEAWETFDLFRSEAAATVRSFKHLSSAQPAVACCKGLAPVAECQCAQQSNDEASLNREGREHPSYDNPLDPFASPDRLPEQSAASEGVEAARPK